jgi:hypothetical protein
MSFPTQSECTHSKPLSATQKRSLKNLTTIISKLVNSAEFQELIDLNGWGSQWGHCRVASEALQILAWEILDIYLVTASYSDGQFSHWFLIDPISNEIYDPTKFQFKNKGDILFLYEEATKRGIQSRIKKYPYTRSPATLEIIEIVKYSLGADH